MSDDLLHRLREPSISGAAAKVFCLEAADVLAAKEMALDAAEAAQLTLQRRIGELTAERDGYASRLGALQAKLDRVMLEYCPDEMGKEQMEEWAKHQKSVDSTQLEADTYQLAVEAVQRRGFSRVNDLLKAYDSASNALEWVHAQMQQPDVPMDLRRAVCDQINVVRRSASAVETQRHVDTPPPEQYRDFVPAGGLVERRGTERCGERRQFGYVALSCNREKGHGGAHATAEGNPFE